MEQGYGKVAGPGLAMAIIQVLAWILTLYNIIMPDNIQLDLTVILGTILVWATPHDAISRLTNGVKS